MRAPIAVAVRIDLGAPVLFRQQRIGLHGRPFAMVKFRSMRHDRRRGDLPFEGPDRRRTHKHPADPRLTRLGRFLRAWSLDELPQLVHVLRGDMSLVGPRPELASVVARYQPWQHHRHLVKPGLTGLWQISGRSDLSWEQSVRLDLRYVENWNLALDAQILWKTFGAVVHSRGAY